MSGCEHNSCGSKDKVWLPYVHQGRNRGLKPHPYCAECGLVKNLSSDRPLGLGYYMNILAALSKEFKIAQAQVRLIALELDSQELCDGYGMDKAQQKELFVKITLKHLNVPEKSIRELI